MRLHHFIFLLFPIGAFALYNGNPSFPMMPEEGIFISKDFWIGVKAGYEFDRVFDRKLHLTGKRIAHTHRKVQEYNSLGNFGLATLNVNERFELFGLLGAMSFHLSQHPFPDTKVSYHTHTDFAWGAGARAIVAYWGDLQLGLNASYVQSDLSLSSLELNGHSKSKQGVEVDFREWQIGAGISYRLQWFIPYLGIDYADFRSRIEHLRSLKAIFPCKHVTFKDNYPVGIFLGFGLSPEKGFNINFEVRLINENAVSASADLKF